MQSRQISVVFLLTLFLTTSVVARGEESTAPQLPASVTRLVNSETIAGIGRTIAGRRLSQSSARGRDVGIEDTFTVRAIEKNCAALVVEANADHAVIWTKPEDLAIDFKKPTAGLTGQADDHFRTVFADGSARAIPITIPTETLRRLLQMNDNEPIGDF